MLFASRSPPFIFHYFVLFSLFFFIWLNSNRSLSIAVNFRYNKFLADVLVGRKWKKMKERNVCVHVNFGCFRTKSPPTKRWKTTCATETDWSRKRHQHSKEIITLIFIWNRTVNFRIHLLTNHSLVFNCIVAYFGI